MNQTISISRTATSVLLLCSVAASTLGQQAPAKDAVNQELQRAAASLAAGLQGPELRQFLSETLESSLNREQLVSTDDLLRLVRERADLRSQVPSLTQFEAAVQSLRRALAAARVVAPFTNVEVYFPVRAHRTSWKGGDDLIVAYAPVGDERQVRSIIGFAVTGDRRVELSPDTAPTTPTLIVATEEHENHRRLAPGVKAPPPDREPPDVRGEGAHDNSYIGIPYVRLENDREPWYKGDPEVFVLIGQSRQNSPREDKVWLNSGSIDVNDEDEWYSIGDCPTCPLYFYYNTDFSDDTYFHFWESDGGGTLTINASVIYNGVTVGLSYPVKDDDDDMGKRTITKSGVALSGYMSQSTGDVRFRVDRDP